MCSDYVVKAHKLTKYFPLKGYPGGFPALNGVDITISRGEFVGLIGVDGAGKTTLLQLLSGLIKDADGKLTVLGQDALKGAPEFQHELGYMPQKFGLYEDLSIDENMNLYADLYNLPQAERPERFAELLKMAGLENFTDRLAGNLSGGMKQKLALVCTLLHQPKLLLLDEPTVGVDPLSRRDLWLIIERLVRESELTVLVSTAYMDEASQCDKLFMLHEGKLLATGSPAEFCAMSDADNMKDAFLTLLARASGTPYVPTLMNRRKPQPTNIEYVIEVENLVKKFGDFTAVASTSFRVSRGEIFGLLGPNGAGKTTTFRMLCGLLPASSGHLSVAGVNIHAARTEARRNIGYVAQKFSLYGNLSVYENLHFFGGVYGLSPAKLRSRIDEVVAEFQLGDYIDTAADNLPGGYHQRLSMATALLHNPQILFLDEPTSGVDPLARLKLWTQVTELANSGTTVIITTHFMEEADYCDRIMIQDHGKMLTIGSPADIRAEYQLPNATMDEIFIKIVESSRHTAV